MSKVNKHEYGVSTLEVVLAVLAVVVVCVIGFAVYHRHATKNTGNLVLQINDSGSTNTRPWMLSLYADGSGKAVNTGLRLGTAKTESYRKGFFAVGSLESLLRKLNVYNLPRCSQGDQTSPLIVSFSASFGSAASITYHGKHIGTFCSDNAAESHISTELGNVVQQANLSE